VVDAAVRLVTVFVPKLVGHAVGSVRSVKGRLDHGRQLQFLVVRVITFFAGVPLAGIHDFLVKLGLALVFQTVQHCLVVAASHILVPGMGLVEGIGVAVGNGFLHLLRVEVGVILRVVLPTVLGLTLVQLVGSVVVGSDAVANMAPSLRPVWVVEGTGDLKTVEVVFLVLVYTLALVAMAVVQVFLDVSLIVGTQLVSIHDD